MEIPEFLANILRATAAATCVDAEKLPGALISCGVFQAAAALCLAFFSAPRGVFEHHGAAAVYLYYGILIAAAAVGFLEASVGFWVSGDLVSRRAVGRTVMLVCVLPLVVVVAIAGFVIVR